MYWKVLSIEYKSNSVILIMSYFLLPYIHFDIKPNNIKLKFEEKLDITINKCFNKTARPFS